MVIPLRSMLPNVKPSPERSVRSTMAPPSSSSNTTPPPPPPPPPPSSVKKIFFRLIVPVVVVTNIFVGVYVLVRTMKKPSQKDGKTIVNVPSAATEKTANVSTPVKVLLPVPENEQRELFKWILEEKRKTKPGNKAEKKKLDEEKALLKEFIRAKSIPSL
ncbi:hypothetical protein AXF42_Ash002585 [Apostasia shenzhenica]|uniref:Uncharacterized protein n=1 Tax=Apostasia shenzhenica TaxID=1088818 RepID=A0A2I0ANZ3_9ASPA|nr:hypothetical protein AXF42_Ash002585 [Apostasia shenzhenica]